MNVSYGALAETIMITSFLVASQYTVLRSGVFSVASTGLAMIGGYTFAILTTTHDVPVPISFAAAIVASTLSAAVLGRLIGRLRGTYQAIATLAFNLMLLQVALLAVPLTGGAAGILGIPLWVSVGSLLPIFVLGFVAIALLDRSLLGRQQAAVRMDEAAAAACGMNVAGIRLGAQTISGALAGVAGACMAGQQFAIDPATFGFAMVVLTLAGAIIGGFRWFLGPIVGATIVASLPILLGGFASYQSVVTAALTLVILAIAPQGLTSLVDVRALSARFRPPRRDEVVERERIDPVMIGAGAPKATLVVDGIARSFGGVRAVGGVSFILPPGEVHGLIGPNGAGKTTCLNLVAGVLRLDEGTIELGGRRVEHLTPHMVSRAGIARTFQNVRLFGEMTAYDNVLVASATTATDKGGLRRRRHEAEALLEQVGIADLANRVADTLPYTDQRRVEIARALATRPAVLLLDEPAAGMTTPEADELAQVVHGIAASGVSVMVVDHNVSWILGMCSRVIVQAGGKVIADGTPDEIRQSTRVKEAYLG